MSRTLLSRRGFLGCGLAAYSLPTFLTADDRPAVTNPRQTSGDRKHQPNWQNKLTVTVGPKSADLVGQSDKVLQAAIDYVFRFGGGTVKVLPGTYTLRNSVFLKSGVRIQGSGADSILKKDASHTVKIAEDSDWYDQEITLENAKGFRVGDGVFLQVKNVSTGGKTVLKRTLVAQSGNRFKLDKALRKNIWLAGQPTVSALFPMVSGEFVHEVVIENLTFDGNKKNNANLNGNYGGCIWLQDCNQITMRNLETHHFNGDGISWQICHDVEVDACFSHDNADLGLHPGSGSQRPFIHNCKSERNTIGLFWCWGVKYGLAENNTFAQNRNYGISIGHNDTDNVMRNNIVQDSGKVGVLFRNDARGKDFWPNRNKLENNQIINSGPESGIAIDIQGKTKDITLIGNQLLEKRKPMQRVGIRIGEDAGAVKLADNQITGFSKKVADLRS